MGLLKPKPPPGPEPVPRQSNAPRRRAANRAIMPAQKTGPTCDHPRESQRGHTGEVAERLKAAVC